MSLSSTTNLVLDIIGYNLFTVHCDATLIPTSAHLEDSVTFLLTGNDNKVNDTVLKGSEPTTVSQRVSIHQNAAVSSGTDTLVYNCTVFFSINGSLITSGSNQTTIIVKGELSYTHFLHYVHITIFPSNI